MFINKYGALHHQHTHSPFDKAVPLAPRLPCACHAPFVYAPFRRDARKQGGGFDFWRRIIQF
jgi:hypothetical protein